MGSRDSVVINAVNDIENLTTGLGRKIWQDQSHGLQLLMQEMQVELLTGTQATLPKC